MGCINKNEIIRSEISHQLSQELNSNPSLKEGIVKINDIKNSNRNHLKNINVVYENSNNSDSNVTNNNNYNNQQSTIGSLISNDYFNKKYNLIGEINNNIKNIEEYKIQLKSIPSIFRSMRKIQRNRDNNDEDNIVFKEVNILKNINHKYLCQLYECITTSNNYFLIMDYCKEGYLENKLQSPIKYRIARNSGPPPDRANDFFRGGATISYKIK